MADPKQPLRYMWLDGEMSRHQFRDQVFGPSMNMQNPAFFSCIEMFKAEKKTQSAKVDIRSNRRYYLWIMQGQMFLSGRDFYQERKLWQEFLGGLLYWQIAVEKIELPAWENIDGLVFPKAAVPLNKKTGLLPKSIRNQGPEISSGTGFQLKASAKAFIPSTLDRSLSNPGVAVRAEGRTIRYHYSWPSSRPSLAWGLELRTTIQPGMTDSPPKDPDSTYSSPPTENSQKPEVVGMPSEKLPVAWRRALERMKWDEYGSRLRGLELDQWRKLLYRHFKRVEVFSMTNEEIASWRKVFKGEYFAFGTTLDDVTFTTRAHPRHSPGALPENCRTSTLGAHCSGCASTMGIWKPFQRG